jgi:hypothetical protein
MFNRIKRFFVSLFTNKKPPKAKHSQEEKFVPGIHIKNRELTKEGIDLLKRRYNFWKQTLHNDKS